MTYKLEEDVVLKTFSIANAYGWSVIRLRDNALVNLDFSYGQDGYLVEDLNIGTFDSFFLDLILQETVGKEVELENEALLFAQVDEDDVFSISVVHFDPERKEKAIFELKKDKE